MSTHTCPYYPCPICASNAVYPPAPPPQRRPYRCPVCDGCGTVDHDFYTRLGVATDTGREKCRACSGYGVIWS